MSDTEQFVLLERAVQMYEDKVDMGAEDYTVHDALFEVSEKFDIELPEGDEYDSLVEELRYELRMD